MNDLQQIGWEYAITRISNGHIVGKPLPTPLALTMRHNDMPNKHRYRISKRRVFAGQWMHGDEPATPTDPARLAARYAHGYQED